MSELLSPGDRVEELNNLLMASLEENRKLKKLLDDKDSESVPCFPSWYLSAGQDCLENPSYTATRLAVKEWDNKASRPLDGFRGTDFCHSSSSPVRILEYLVIPPSQAQSSVNGFSTGSSYPRLLGLVHFTPKAESGRGYCHGGSMCAVMDDALGWMGFCCAQESSNSSEVVTAEGGWCVVPWSGYTVQVNTSLRQPVSVGSLLRLEAWVDEALCSQEEKKLQEKLQSIDTGNESSVKKPKSSRNRKLWVKARLVSGNMDDGSKEIVYCEANGLFLRTI